MQYVRIVGGQWRSRNLRFKPNPLIRPTPNRVRETLFNWLAPWLPGAACLDLFAGSGALSFEALSRGAASCTLLDNNPETCRQIRNEAIRFAAKNIKVQLMDAALFVRRPMRHYDVVFLDPPFARGLMDKIVAPLSRALRGGPAMIYMEMGRGESCTLPKNWHCLHDKKTRQTRYSLVCSHADETIDSRHDRYLSRHV